MAPFTRLIVVVNIAVALFSFFCDWTGRPDWVRETFTLTYQGWLGGAWWQLFGYMWLHAPFEGAGILHLTFNMFTLVVLGNLLERRLGAVRYVLVYLAGGLVAGLCFLLEIWFRIQVGAWIPEAMDGGVVGASGGVAALFGAFAVLFPEIRLLLFLVPWPVRAIRAFWIFVLLSVGLMFVPEMSWMAHGAHLGGALTGYFLIRSRLLSRTARTSREAVMGQGVWEELGLRQEVDAMSREELVRAFQEMERRWQAGGTRLLSERDRLVVRRLGEWIQAEDRRI